MSRPLSPGALALLESRYLRHDDSGNPIEGVLGLWQRVAWAVAEPGRTFGEDVDFWEARFLQRLERLEFLPNSPTLMNAGLPGGQLAACFVLPIDDDLDSIFTTLARTARIHQTGGGTGFSFSSLRPRGDRVRSTGGVTSGPLSFIELFDHTTAVISAGGRRRGANMAVLRVDHPDIEELIDAKRGGDRLTNFNLSVGTTAEFWTAQERGDRFPLRNPRSGAVVRSVDPNRLLDRIAAAAWECGDPGLLFFDRIERDNPTPELGSIEATNPCGEQPLLPNESCTLGSLNLAAFALDDDLDWPRFREAVHDAVRFLDNVIEANRYPFPDIETATRRTRKIGLGVMGLADLLARLRMPYDSPAARALGSRIAQTLTGEARAASVALGRQRGSFPALTRSRWPQRGFDCLRNAAVTCVAPTGSVSYLAGVSSGIEPFFALATARRFADGRMVEELVPCFREALKCLPDGGDALLATIQARGSFAGLEGVPDEWRRRFQTALEIAPADHLAMQAVFQEHVDAAVSKTVNLAADTTCEVVREIFLLARRLDLKGVTVYRYGSRPRQTLSLAGEPECRECAF